MSHTFLSTIALRRSTYALSPTSPIPDSRIREIVSDVLLKAPSAFNTQTSRVILLLGDGHRRLWDIVSESLIEKIGKERYEQESKEGIEGKKGAYGTVSLSSMKKWCKVALRCGLAEIAFWHLGTIL